MVAACVMDEESANPFVQPDCGVPARVIVALTTQHGRLVRTRRFRKPTYIGDPINAVRIFSEKGADELLLLEIGRQPLTEEQLVRAKAVASEALMPIGYGGGIRTIEDVRAVIRGGFEKVVLNTALHADLSIASRAADEFGSQAVVASIECAKGLFCRRHVRTDCGRRRVAVPLCDWAVRCEAAGCGEILLTSIDRDGMMSGYDTDAIRDVSAVVTIPVIPLGGAGSLEHLGAGLRAGGSAVAAGSMFVLHGPRRAVLITYPDVEIGILRQ